MPSIRVRLLRTPYFAMALMAMWLPAVIAEEPETSHSFQLTVTSSIRSETQGQKRQTDTQTILLYTLQRKGSEVAVIFDEIRIKATRDGSESMDVSMSRAKYRETVQGQVQEIALEQAPNELRKMLQDSFGVPVCKVFLAENGKELKRTMVAGPGAANLLEAGQVANARLFHTPFPVDKEEWQAEREISMGRNAYASEIFTYKKSHIARAGQTVVKVSGMLTTDKVKPPGLPSRYEVSGEQSYDAARQEWIAGDLLFQVSFQVQPEGMPIIAAKGTMRVKLELLPAK